MPCFYWSAFWCSLIYISLYDYRLLTADLHFIYNWYLYSREMFTKVILLYAIIRLISKQQCTFPRWKVSNYILQMSYICLMIFIWIALYESEHLRKMTASHLVSLLVSFMIKVDNIFIFNLLTEMYLTYIQRELENKKSWITLY